MELAVAKIYKFGFSENLHIPNVEFDIEMRLNISVLNIIYVLSSGRRQPILLWRAVGDHWNARNSLQWHRSENTKWRKVKKQMQPMWPMWRVIKLWSKLLAIHWNAGETHKVLRCGSKANPKHSLFLNFSFGTVVVLQLKATIEFSWKPPKQCLRNHCFRWDWLSRLETLKTVDEWCLD